MEIKQPSTLVTKGDKVGIVRSSDGKHINIKGGIKAQQAVQALSRFGLIRYSRDQSFKSSYYSIHFIKPVSKLKQLYNLGEEILILCCNDSMSNFKSRTKDLIDYLLGSQSEFRNRLDKVTCFLVDDCDNIEELIKRDRNENPDSRLIVPFSYSELENGISEEAFQIRLRAFLYERDLFGVASPLRDDVLFFGKSRFDVISELYGKYLQGEHGGLFGLRRIGKTSILNLLRNRVEQNGGIAIYLDCTKYYHLKWNMLLHQIVNEIYIKYSIGSYETPVGFLPDGFSLISEANYTEDTASLSFETDLKSIHHCLNNRRILLIFDEIERISFGTSPSKHWSEENDALFFWDALRSISQTDTSIFSFVIAGVNPKCIEDSKINGQTNPIFNALTPQYITLFDYDDVKTMVSAIGGHLGLFFEEEVYSKLVDDYGGHPFLTRQVCSKINADVLNNKEHRPFCVSKYSYEKQAPDYRSKLEGVIQQILGVLEDFYPPEYELLKVLALDGSAAFKKKLSFGDSSIAHLLGYCLITRDHGDYYIRIKTVASYLNEKHKYEKTLDNASEKRARITVRRGLIEEKLRRIIQANLTLKYGKKAKEHMISIVKNATTDKNQEAKLQSKEFKEAMQELYFSQLKVLMLKDWNSYQALFVDKVKFEQFFDIINSHRADAHAKSLDEEDEAILNYAFKFFEKALEEI
ncbi:MAG: ATP-binding protein [Oscillospiraceae bacterium]|nr:ATP-binding protein [Oscillospiraceae bacterium]MBR3557189.1 ATP-binding protein [Oscillospiraceae bacterium]